MLLAQPGYRVVVMHQDDRRYIRKLFISCNGYEFLMGTHRHNLAQISLNINAVVIQMFVCFYILFVGFTRIDHNYFIVPTSTLSKKRKLGNWSS